MTDYKSILSDLVDGMEIGREWDYLITDEVCAMMECGEITKAEAHDCVGRHGFPNAYFTFNTPGNRQREIMAEAGKRAGYAFNVCYPKARP